MTTIEAAAKAAWEKRHPNAFWGNLPEASKQKRVDALRDGLAELAAEIERGGAKYIYLAALRAFDEAGFRSVGIEKALIAALLAAVEEK